MQYGVILSEVLIKPRHKLKKNNGVFYNFQGRFLQYKNIILFTLSQGHFISQGRNKNLS